MSSSKAVLDLLALLRHRFTSHDHGYDSCTRTHDLIDDLPPSPLGRTFLHQSTRALVRSALPVLRFHSTLEPSAERLQISWR